MVELAAGSTRRFTGWGRSTGSVATLVAASSLAELAQRINSASRPGLLARGLGRAYGDAATNAGGTLLAPFRPDAALSVDTERALVSAPAGASLDRLLRELLPLGLMLPVVPGTRHVSLGGAIAADVHGKNHHRDSSFGRWVDRLTLIDGQGQTRELSPTGTPELFWATVGGMGLTGVIVSATVRLIRISSTQMRVSTTRIADFDELLSRLSATPAPRYQVAWVDCLAPGRHRFRSVLDEGDHAEASELAPAQRARALRWPAGHALPAPRLPANLVRPALTRAFNAAWWHKAPSEGTRLLGLDRFFFPLDGLADWARLYGPRGFLQYQLVVPPAAEALLRKALERLVVAALPSLVVLKRMGAATGGPLSFPFEGWTLAVDLPAGDAGMLAALNELDEWVVEAGGRVYLAKDSRLTPQTLAAMYPALEAWRSTRAKLDPDRRFSSDLARRLRLT